MCTEVKNSIIYKIACKDSNVTECYVGKTKNLENREYHHKHKCGNDRCKEHMFKLYQFIRKHGGFANFVVSELERVIGNKFDTSQRERFHIDTLGSTLNKQKPCKYKCQKSSYDVGSKEYKEELSKYKNEKFMCECCGGRYTMANRSKHFKSKRHINAMSV
jgi:hypothetical protein